MTLKKKKKILCAADFKVSEMMVYWPTFHKSQSFMMKNAHNQRNKLGELEHTNIHLYILSLKNQVVFYYKVKLTQNKKKKIYKKGVKVASHASHVRDMPSIHDRLPNRRGQRTKIPYARPVVHNLLPRVNITHLIRVAHPSVHVSPSPHLDSARIRCRASNCGALRCGRWPSVSSISIVFWPPRWFFRYVATEVGTDTSRAV